MTDLTSTEQTAEPYTGPVIAVPVYAGVSELELSFMLSLARLCAHPDAAKTVNRSRASIVSAGGLVTTPHSMYTTLPEPTALFIPGGPGASKASRDPLLKGFLQAHRSLLTAATGSGLLLAGEGGLLGGKQVGGPADLADTFWGYEPADVQPGQVVQDGAFISTPGGLPAFHAAFAVAQALWGAEVAMAAAQRLGGNGLLADFAGGRLPTPPRPPSQRDGGS